MSRSVWLRCTGLLGTVCLLAGCGAGAQEKPAAETAPITSASGEGRSVCGVVPARAITLAVGTASWRTEDSQEMSRSVGTTPQTCFAVSRKAGRRLLSIEKAPQADPGAVAADIRARIRRGAASVPDDVAATGYVVGTDGYQHLRLLEGQVMVDVYLRDGVEGRSARRDVLAVTRLVLPRILPA